MEGKTEEKVKEKEVKDLEKKSSKYRTENV